MISPGNTGREQPVQNCQIENGLGEIEENRKRKKEAEKTNTRGRNKH